ncbi:MAG TPA: DNRLRE domain-containing protein [Opitutaceae bacterium]|nr:DNRLRE domain-containing protein [Opitutaceae bacterium]
MKPRFLLLPLTLCAALVPSAFAQESVHTIRRSFVSPITPEIKSHLRAVKLRGDALGRSPGILGQWGDSITNSVAYLGGVGCWGMITIPPADGHDYVPVLLWMGASPGTNSSPLYRFKGGNYCNDSGWRVPNALAVVDDAIVRANPSWSLTMYGTNDIRQSSWSPAVYNAQLQRLVQINIDAGVVPVLSTIPPCTGYDTRVAEANAVVRQVAASLRIPLVDLHGVFMALHPDDWASVLLSDGVHPSHPYPASDLSETPQRDDGYNIRSMLTVDMAEKIRAIIFDNAPPDGADLPGLVVTSSTHPYKVLTASLAPVLEFTHDSGPAPTAYSWTVDQSPWTEPDMAAEGTAPAATVSLASAGTWYFHVRADSAAGWGPATHYCLRAADAPTIELRHETGTSPHHDTLISALWGANDNFGGAATLNTYNDGTIARSRGLFSFDLTSVPAAGLETATLVLNVDGALSSATAWELYPVTSAWTEGTGNGNDDASGVTWVTQPTYGTTALGSGSLAAGATAIEIDLTTAVRGWLAAPDTNFGVMLQHRSLYRSLYLITREYAATELRPTLRLRYAAAVDLESPSTPGSFSATPVGAASVGLTWTASNDNVAVTGYRIYRDGALLDSTTGTAFTDSGLPAATTFNYSVVAFDAAGNASPAAGPLTVSTPIPTLYAGADREITVRGGTCLEAVFPDLALSTDLGWSQVSGPAGARIVNPTSPHTPAYFETGGDYTFRCTVTSGGNTFTDDVVVTVDDTPFRRRTVNVANVAQLRAAFASAQSGDIILLNDGLYDLAATPNSSGGTWCTLSAVDDIDIRSASGAPAAVTIRGNGFADRSDNADGFWLMRCARVTVRGLTFSGFGAYALKLEANTTPVAADIRIEHCRFLDTGMRCIKGTITPEDAHVHRGWVRDCTFANSALPPETAYSGDYIAAIDMMALCNWEFADNTFIDIMGRTGGGRAAVFLWHRTRGTVVERNFISGCDRGIAFGNPSGTTETHASWSLARNNVVVMERTDGIEPAEPLELAQVEHIRLVHNTAWRASASARGLRCSAFAHDTEAANNLVRGQATLGAGVTAHHNLFGDVAAALFVDPASADFHLTPSAAAAIDQGVALATASTDFDRIARDAAPDLGAFEYVAPPPAVYATWRSMSFFGSDLTEDAISGPDADPDGAGVTNFARYAFGLPARGPVTAPTTVGTATAADATYLTLTFNRRATASDLAYTVEASSDLVNWTTVSTFAPGTPAQVTAQDSVALGTAGVTRRFLRVRVAAP